MLISNLQSVFGDHMQFSTYEGLKLLEKSFNLKKIYIYIYIYI